MELFNRAKNTLSALLVFARTPSGIAATSTRQISRPSRTTIRARVRDTGTLPIALMRWVVNRLTKPSPFLGFTFS